MLNSKNNHVYHVYHVYAYSDPDRGYGFSHTLEYVVASSPKEALAKSNYKGMLPGVHHMTDSEMETAMDLHKEKINQHQRLHDQLFDALVEAGEIVPREYRQ